MSMDDEAERTGWSVETLFAARAAHAQRLQAGTSATAWRHLSADERDELCEQARAYLDWAAAAEAQRTTNSFREPQT